MQFTLKEKERDAFRKKLSRKTKLSSIKTDVTLFIISLVISVLGVYCAYFAYLKLGIDSMLNLCTFILGITLAVIGLQRTFDWLGSLIEKLSGLKLPDTRPYIEEYGFLKSNLKSCIIDLTEEGIKLSYSGYTMNLPNGKYVLCPEMEEFVKFKEVFVLADRSKKSFILFTYDIIQEQGDNDKCGLNESMMNRVHSIYVSEDWFLFSDDYRAVVEKFKEVLPEGHFKEFKEFSASFILNSPYIDMGKLCETFEVAGDWEEDSNVTSSDSTSEESSEIEEGVKEGSVESPEEKNEDADSVETTSGTSEKSK